MVWLVAGLGNIGDEYTNTRHNMGFIVLDAWAQASNTVFSIDRYGSIAEVSDHGNKFILLKPSTYMNLSGKAVRYWMQEKNIPLERVVVICDDLNLPFGSIRMRSGGSDGGHNGLKNIIELAGSQEFARIRLGIGNEYSRGGQIDFVLGKMAEEEIKQTSTVTADRVIAGVKCLASAGMQRAMSATNFTPKKEETK